MNAVIKMDIKSEISTLIRNINDELDQFKDELNKIFENIDVELKK